MFCMLSSHTTAGMWRGGESRHHSTIVNKEVPSFKCMYIKLALIYPENNTPPNTDLVAQLSTVYYCLK